MGPGRSPSREGPTSRGEPTRAGGSGAYDPAEREALLSVARRSVAHGVHHASPLPVEPRDFAPALRAVRACFVTLRRGGALRGCMGTLEATQPLAVDVAQNAWRAAHRDPRFPPVEEEELEALALHVSVLGPLQPFPVESEAELLSALRPGVDGLVLRDGALGSTFLPAVWESRPRPADFVVELKRKAGLPDDHWSATISFERYTVEEIE